MQRVPLPEESVRVFLYPRTEGAGGMPGGDRREEGRSDGDSTASATGGEKTIGAAELERRQRLFDEELRSRVAAAPTLPPSELLPQGERRSHGEASDTRAVLTHAPLQWSAGGASRHALM